MHGRDFQLPGSFPLQLQNSKTVIQAKDAVIQELKERVAYLEAEVCLNGAVSGQGGVVCSELRFSVKPPRLRTWLRPSWR